MKQKPRKKPFITLIFLFASCSGFAQLSRKKEELQQYYIQQSEACGGVSELLKKKGSWKKSSYGDDIAFPDKTFSPNQYNILLERIEKILPIAKEGITDLAGFEPVWYGSVRGNSLVANGPVPASFNCGVFTYSCNNAGKISLGDEASSSLTIYINNYGIFSDKIDDWNINNDGKMIAVYEMPESIGKWKGLTLYEPKKTGGPGLPTDRAVVIGHNGQMPWHILTQKQYLTGYKNFLEKNRKEQLEGNDSYVKKMTDNIASMKASKAMTEDQKKEVVEKLERQLKNFQDNIVQKNTEAAEKIFNDNMKPVKEYLDTASAKTLNQPAVLDKNTNISFRGYFAKEGEAGIKLCCFTTKYFNKDLPRYVPQFMVLYWKWGQDPPSLHFAKQMEEKLPVDKLKALIDK
jgi:hypothetical protein